MTNQVLSLHKVKSYFWGGSENWWQLFRDHIPNTSVTSANYSISYPLFPNSFRAQLTCIFTVLDSWHQNWGFSMFWVFVWSLSHLSFSSFPKPGFCFLFMSDSWSTYFSDCVPMVMRMGGLIISTKIRGVGSKWGFYGVQYTALCGWVCKHTRVQLHKQDWSCCVGGLLGLVLLEAAGILSLRGRK